MTESVPICACLIDWGVEVNIQVQSGNYGSGLVAAAFRGRKEVVQLFLKSRAEVNIRVQSGDYSSRLVAAAFGIRGD